MTTTMTRPTRWFSITGLGAISTVTLAACGGGAPELTEIADSAQQSLEEASSITYSVSDPDNLADETLEQMEYSGQLDETNFHLSATMDDAVLEALIVDPSTAFMKFDFADEELRSMTGMTEEHEGMWIAAPEENMPNVDELTGLFDELSVGVFDLINNLSEEELDAVEVEETELDGDAVYKYTVPATGEVETEVVPGADTASFYFLEESSELVQLDGSTDDATIVISFSDYDNVDLVEAPPEDEIADLDWEF